jgi:hypothetical protein
MLQRDPITQGVEKFILITQYRPHMHQEHTRATGATQTFPTPRVVASNTTAAHSPRTHSPTIAELQVPSSRQVTLGFPAKPAEHVAVHTAPALVVVEQLNAPLAGFSLGAVEHTIAAGA